jgi:hypothetical protein
MALRPLYVASATVTSGREGFGETSDGSATRGNIDVQIGVE